MRRLSLSQNYQNVSACQFLDNACAPKYASCTQFVDNACALKYASCTSNAHACTLLSSAPSGANTPSTISGFPHAHFSLGAGSA